jgi:transposase
MLVIPPQLPVFVHRDFVDFRKGMDGLIGVCKYELGQDPQSGCVFVFSNRRRQGFKILVYDGQGYWVCYKRLSSGRMRYWPEGSEVCLELMAKELQVLIYNGDPRGLDLQMDWRGVRR